MPLNESTVEVNHSSDPLVGTLLAGRYQILANIGVGGMGAVYKARHKDTDAIVAIKLINPTLLTEIQTVQRFRQEATILSDLKHPNIVQVKAFEVDEGRCFMVLEYLDGKNLSDVIATEGPLGASEFSKLFGEITQGLQCAHSNSIIHRDLKPSNLMVVQDAQGQRHLKLLDFGVSKQLNGTGQLHTQAGATVGSPMYMSPEQFIGSDVDARSDIYSLGCVMYYALTGKDPFQADNTMELVHKHVSETLQPLNGVDSAQFDLMIQKATAKNPAQRYQTADQLRLALLHGESEDINAAAAMQKVPGKAARVMNLKALGIGALMLSVLAGVTCLAVQNRSKPEIAQLEQQTDRPPQRLLADIVLKVVGNEIPATDSEVRQLLSHVSHPDLANVAILDSWDKKNTSHKTEMGRNGNEALAWQAELKGNYAQRDMYFAAAIEYSHLHRRTVPTVAKDWAYLLCRHNQRQRAIEVLEAEKAYCNSAQFEGEGADAADECADAIKRVGNGGTLFKEILSDYDARAKKEQDRRKRRRKHRTHERNEEIAR